MTWLALGALLKRFGSWLGSLNVWQLLLIVALLFGGLQTLRLKAEQRHSAKVEAQLSKATTALNQLRSESRVQQKTVTKQIDHYITVEKPVIRDRIREIEAAPLPGGCKTPQAVLDADV